jgi:hypothetical protein
VILAVRRRWRRRHAASPSAALVQAARGQQARGGRRSPRRGVRNEGPNLPPPGKLPSCWVQSAPFNALIHSVEHGAAAFAMPETPTYR